MTLSLGLLLIPFGLLLVVWFIFSIVAITKMLRFGFVSRLAVISSFGYVLFAVVALILVVSSLRSVDWSASLDIGTPSISLPNLQDATKPLQP